MARRRNNTRAVTIVRNRVNVVRSRSRGMFGRVQLPIAVIAGIAPTGVKIWEARGGGTSGMVREAGRILTGFDFWNGQFIPGAMRYGLLPLIAGVLVHKVVGGWLGANRALARSGIPLIRI